MNTTVVPVPSRRRHTLAFLRAIRPTAPVYLSTDVDVSILVQRRTAAPRRYSYVTYMVAALGQALTKHPEANVAVGGSWLAPRIAQYGSVDVKLALDKTDGGVRHVASAVIRDVASLDVEEFRRMSTGSATRRPPNSTSWPGPVYSIDCHRCWARGPSASRRGCPGVRRYWGPWRSAVWGMPMCTPSTPMAAPR